MFPVVPLVVPGNGELLPDTRRSDHVAFCEQGSAWSGFVENGMPIFLAPFIG
jgi:hypothetical protein